MSKKIRVGFICGGRSAEHEVSLRSLRNILQFLDKEKYEPVLMSISKSGQWALHHTPEELFHNGDDPARISLLEGRDKMAIAPTTQNSSLITLDHKLTPQAVDVIFPVLHGTYGEDGTMQGLLKLANIPFVGPEVLGSAVGMDKDIMKRLLREAGIPTARFVTIHRRELSTIRFSDIEKELGLPFFIKPANAGSSIGISKVKSASEFQTKLLKAFQYDHKVLCEEYMKGRELECSVLGNETPIASLPCEVIPLDEFYTYEAKYISAEGARFEVPAKLSPKIVRQVQQLAIQTCQTLACEGMARVDFFLNPDDTLYVNEINTIPGFTPTSMYPKMWEASGLSYTALLDKLIQFAVARFERDKILKTHFSPLTDEETALSETLIA